MEDEICPHCRKTITDEDKEDFWIEQTIRTYKLLLKRKI